MKHLCLSGTSLATAVLFFSLAPLTLAAQAVAPPPAAPVNPPPATASQAPTKQGSAPVAEPDVHMTKEQAADLFRSVDEILGFVSKDSHLKATRPVKRRLLTREQVRHDLQAKMNDDKSTKRLERSELVLKKFGLLDRDFQLRPFLLSLLTEQVAAYYEPKTRTVNLIDWVKPEEQKPVLAHELTHAVQDDRVHLEKWGDPESSDISKDVTEDNQHVQLDEASTAREAVTEGQAMAVYVDYMLKDVGKTLKDAPEFGKRAQEMAADTSGSPVLSRAPLLLQESLLFPYGEGMNFEQQLLIAGSVDTAFAGALDHPPTSSHEILHPDDYLKHVPVPVLTMPDVHGLLDKQWEPDDVGVMGELDVRIMAELFGDPKLATPIAEQWAGGLYYAAQRRDASSAEKTTTKSIGVLYYSQWKSRDAARAFLRMYAGELERKYGSLKHADAPGTDADHLLFTTGEGDVWLSLQDNGLFISESFDRGTAKQLETMFRDAQGHGPLQTAGIPAHELTFGFGKSLPGIGVAHAVMAHAIR